MDKAKARKLLIPALGTMPSLLLAEKAYAGPTDSGDGEPETPTEPGANGGQRNTQNNTSEDRKGRLEALEDKISQTATKTQFEEVSNRVANLEHEAATAHILFGILDGLLFLTIIVVCFVGGKLFFGNSKSDLEKKLKKSMRELENKYASRSEVDALSKQIDEISYSASRQASDTKVDAISSAPLDSPVRSRPQESLPAQPPYADFLDAYNKLAQEGFNANSNKARENLVSCFHVQAFKCANDQERTKSPETAPAFVSAEIAHGHYWAMPLPDNQYAVVPGLVAVKSYNENHHIGAGMETVFEVSGYKHGSYKKIVVIRPAIFSGQWTVKEKGTLSVSN